MIYTAEQNKHQFKPLKFKLYLKPRNFIYKVTFHESCEYDLGYAGNLQINKLFGASKGLHKWESARFGWRYDKKSNKIILFAYSYYKGKRVLNEDKDIIYKTKEIVIDRVDLEKEILLKLEVKDNCYNFYTRGQYRVTTPSSFPLNIGYELGPYFGGEFKTTHMMSILLNKIV